MRDDVRGPGPNDSNRKSRLPKVSMSLSPSSPGSRRRRYTPLRLPASSSQKPPSRTTMRAWRGERNGSSGKVKSASARPRKVTGRRSAYRSRRSPPLRSTSPQPGGTGAAAGGSVVRPELATRVWSIGFGAGGRCRTIVGGAGAAAAAGGSSKSAPQPGHQEATSPGGRRNPQDTQAAPVPGTTAGVGGVAAIAATGAVDGAVLVPGEGSPGIAPWTEIESGSAGAVAGSAPGISAVAVRGGLAGSRCPHSLQKTLRSTLRAPQVGQGFMRIPQVASVPESDRNRSPSGESNRSTARGPGPADACRMRA